MRLWGEREREHGDGERGAEEKKFEKKVRTLVSPFRFAPCRFSLYLSLSLSGETIKRKGFETPVVTDESLFLSLLFSSSPLFDRNLSIRT